MVSMKINLSRKELERCYQLLDAKEINISIADMLFASFQEKNYFLNANNPEVFYLKLLSFWGINEDDYQDIELLDKIVKPMISFINHEQYINNPYFKSVKSNPVKTGDYELIYESYNPYQPLPLDEIEVDSLMNELLKLPNPFSCPHGRPTVIKMSKYDIERKFGRK